MSSKLKYYRFDPQEDITAYELALALSVFGGDINSGILRYPPECMKRCKFARHFKETKPFMFGYAGEREEKLKGEDNAAR